MKKPEITITLDEARMDALEYFMGKQKMTPQVELEKHLRKLYDEHVPPDTREYLESRRQATTARPRPKKLTEPKRTQEQKQAATPSPSPERKEQVGG